MSVIRDIASSKHEAERYLHPDNLVPQYDASLLNDGGELSLELRSHIPFMPVMIDYQSLQEKSEERRTAVPVLDHETPFEEYMALLVAQSVLAKNLYVMYNVPYPSSTQYPTRINTGLGGKRVYPPIVGFIVQGDRSRFGRKEAALIVGSTAEQEIIPLGRRQSGSTVAGLLLGACWGAERKHTSYRMRNPEAYQDVL